MEDAVAALEKFEAPYVLKADGLAAGKGVVIAETRQNAIAALSDMFGGGLGAAAAGSTSMERNLDRLTVVFGLIFTFLTLTLAFLIEN